MSSISSLESGATLKLNIHNLLHKHPAHAKHEHRSEGRIPAHTNDHFLPFGRHPSLPSLPKRVLRDSFGNMANHLL